MQLLADLGEGIGDEENLIPLLDAGAISCGAHAGDKEMICRTIRRCVEQGVSIGAHPSFVDRAHFGRLEQSLSADELRDLLLHQFETFKQWTNREGAAIRFVKPHGALYNLSARNTEVAKIIAETIYSVDPSWVLVGLAGSVSIQEAKAAGLSTLSEAFADRRYVSAAVLCPRSDPRALLETPEEAVAQVQHLMECGGLLSVNGDFVSLAAEVVCVHGDSKQAVSIARAVRTYLNDRLDA